MALRKLVNITPETISKKQRYCEINTQSLLQILEWFANHDGTNVLLYEFAHSASCQKKTCTPICLMFRRVRHHVVVSRHPHCSVLILYSTLLHTHVSSCVNDDCGLPACHRLKTTRSTIKFRLAKKKCGC